MDLEMLKLDNRMKWRCTFFLISLAVALYVFMMVAIGKGIITLSAIEAIGVGTLGGFLITSSALTVQYWFRRKPPEMEK